jgi:hypothetical protein
MEIKTEDGYEFEIGPDDDREGRCKYVHRVGVHPSIKVGGPSIGRCTNDALPGMRMCYMHASREAMSMAIRMYAKKIEELGGKI